MESNEMEQETESKTEEIKLITVDNKEFSTGDDITLPCHLSPESSAVGMEIRWFKGTECIYLYRCGHVTVREDYEGRVSLNTQRLHKGDVSLRLKESREGDTGRYGCQVISEQHMEGTRVGLRYDGGRGVIYSIYQRAEKMEKRLKATTILTEKTTEKTFSLEKKLQDRTRQTQDLSIQLQDKERELEDRDQQLEERDRQLEDRDRQLEERDKLLEERDKLLEEKDRQLEERDKLLHDKKHLTVRINHLPRPASISEWGSDRASICSGLHNPEFSYITKTWSMGSIGPPNLGGESPGPAPPVSPAVSELRLVLLGGSAAGKRAAGNTILGTHTLTHTSTETQHSESRQGEVAGRRVTLVETPDWFCSGLFEKDMRQDVGLCVRLSAPGPHAFLLLIPVEPSEGEERRMLEKMEDIFGEGCWRHTLILFTHAEGLRERSVEELLQTGSQELQQLVEKCGNRCHLLNVKDRPDDTQITQLLEKIEEMESGNRERFYSSDTYQEAERQIREIERRMEKEQRMEERKVREERERTQEFEKNVRESLERIEEEIRHHEGEIRMINQRTTELAKKVAEEWDEDTKSQMEQELKNETLLRKDMEEKLKHIREQREKEKRQMEERHREEMEEMREGYEREARAEAERNMMNVILTDLQRHITITQLKMEAEFNRQLEERNCVIETVLWELRERDAILEKLTQRQTEGERHIEEATLNQEQEREMERMKYMLEEANREMERMRHMLEEKNRETERLRLRQRREGNMTENNRQMRQIRTMRQISLKMSRELDKLKEEISNLSHSQTLLREVCENDVSEWKTPVENIYDSYLS